MDYSIRQSKMFSRLLEMVYRADAQITKNRWIIAPKETGLARSDRLFEKWLFWRDAGGGWAPENPPYMPEYLGIYGNREFWTTSHACLSDFIILTINATANSHAAALNTQKVGPTPALTQ